MTLTNENYTKKKTLKTILVFSLPPMISMLIQSLYNIVDSMYVAKLGNDANAEYVAYLRNVFDNANICFQTAELGKVDQGGGGTIAYILANYNMNVIDAGIAVLNMHSPMEIVSKADVYEAYLAYKAFLLA